MNRSDVMSRNRLQELYETFTPEQKQEFLTMRQNNPNMDDRKIVYAILDKQKQQKRRNQMRQDMRPVSTRVITKWEDVLKRKKKKPFKGYNKKIHAKTGGLSAKGRAKFKRETGANLKRPVTKKPSKLKPGGKAAKRRKSFCARSRGFKRADGTYSEKAKAARRRWNC